MPKRKINKRPSSYSDFTLDDLQSMFGIETTDLELRLNRQIVNPSDWLLKTMEMSTLLTLNTEKAKSESIIMPILLELRSLNLDNCRVFSGNSFDVDKSLSLVGRCDFLLSSNPTVNISAPVVSIFEAKNDNLEDWYGQCGSEMYAAHLFNLQKNKPVEFIYGAVTNGFDWQFLKLQENALHIDTKRYFVDNLPQLLGVLQTVLDFYK